GLPVGAPVRGVQVTVTLDAHPGRVGRRAAGVGGVELALAVRRTEPLEATARTDAERRVTAGLAGCGDVVTDDEAGLGTAVGVALALDLHRGGPVLVGTGREVQRAVPVDGLPHVGTAGGNDERAALVPAELTVDVAERQ